MKIMLQDHMSADLITVKKDTTAGDAQRLMTNFWIRHLPVIDEAEEAIVGILSERDLLRSPSPDIPVEQLMSSPLKTFSVDATLVEVVDAMIDEKISAFLITKEDQVAGIVSTEDMLIVLSELLQEDNRRTWVLSELLVNPNLQRAAYIISQSGI